MQLHFIIGQFCHLSDYTCSIRIHHEKLPPHSYFEFLFSFITCLVDDSVRSLYNWDCSGFNVVLRVCTARAEPVSFSGRTPLQACSFWGASRWPDGFPPSNQHPGHHGSDTWCRSPPRPALLLESPGCVTHWHSSSDLEKNDWGKMSKASG